VPPDNPVPPPSQLFVTYRDQKDTTYFNDTDFKNGSGTDAKDQCRYQELPKKTW
jgi:hypothetical protein